VYHKPPIFQASSFTPRTPEITQRYMVRLEIGLPPLVGSSWAASESIIWFVVVNMYESVQTCHNLRQGFDRHFVQISDKYFLLRTTATLDTA
jgi:hypothetical protein